MQISFLEKFSVLPDNIPAYYYRWFVFANYSAFLSMCLHASWIVAFYFAGYFTLAIFNIFSVMIFISALYMNFHGWLKSAFILASIEVTCHAILSVTIMGWDSGFHYFIVFLPVAIFYFPKGKAKVKSLLALMWGIIYIGLYLYSTTNLPITQNEIYIVDFFRFANIVCFVFSLTILTYFFSSAVITAENALQLEKGKVKEAYSLLSKYVAPQLADTISDGKIDQVWKHNRKKLTLFFSDIKNFTRITDTLEPEDMATVLNEYLTEMNIIINKYSGTLAQVIGDGLYVIFGAPKSTSDKDHALKCVKMAIDMQHKMNDLNKKWFKQGIDEVLQIRCGINTGMATVGGYGSTDRKEYTAMGMQTNIAARLEQSCKPGRILISHATWALVNGEIPCTEYGKIDAKGLNKPIRAYSIDALSNQN
jgi:class 3 adenylate cyclase